MPRRVRRPRALAREVSYDGQLCRHSGVAQCTQPRCSCSAIKSRGNSPNERLPSNQCPHLCQPPSPAALLSHVCYPANPAAHLQLQHGGGLLVVLNLGVAGGNALLWWSGLNARRGTSQVVQLGFTQATVPPPCGCASYPEAPRQCQHPAAPATPCHTPPHVPP